MFPVLTNCPLFRGVEIDRVNELLGQSSYIVNKYEANALIARRDMAYSGLLIIIEGSVRGTVTLAGGKEQIIDTVGAGQLIAPAFLFGGYNRLPIDVYANEPAKIMTLHRGSLFEMMQDDTVVLSNFIDIISNRANYFSRRIYALTVLMLKEKVAAYLLNQAMHNTDINFNVHNMANAIDATRESCVQTLSELEKKGLIKIAGESLQIIDRKALQDILA